jgi:hypothetical protein
VASVDGGDGEVSPSINGGVVAVAVRVRGRCSRRKARPGRWWEDDGVSCLANLTTKETTLIFCVARKNETRFVAHLAPEPDGQK